MNTEDNWAVKLANNCVPDEVDLAPIMTQAYIKGGKARLDLFHKEANDNAGAFGGSIEVIFPYILESIAVAAPLIISTLTTALPIINELLTAVNDFLEIRDNINKRSFSNDPYL